MDSDLSSFKPLYIKTGKEYIEKLKQNLNQLLQNTSDKAATNEVYISAHSLKSQSLMMGYTTTGLVCRTIEELFKAHKELNTPPVNQQAVQLALTLVQKMNDSLTQIEGGGSELDFTQDAITIRQYTIQGDKGSI